MGKFEKTKSCKEDNEDGGILARKVGIRTEEVIES